ncbi:RICIN domain-containing protein [Gynuella sp.]|uniref:RICIN domain-containing protein n=1 Tax=Gynuella sp. TaxID=2969146 RepID=UPI003D0E8BE4
MFKKIIGCTVLLLLYSSAQAIENGRYNIVSSLSGLYMDVSNRSQDDGANVLQYTGNGATNQQFDVTALGDGTYSIRAVHSGKSLDVAGYSMDDGAQVQQWTYHGGDNQRWYIDTAANGFYSVTSKLNGKALDVWEMSTQPGGDIRLYSWWGGAGQLWSFLPVGGGDPTDPTDPTDPPAGTNPSAGCGNVPSLSSGRHSIYVNGARREYILDVPANYDMSKPYRLIFGWHWLGGNASNVANGGYYGLKNLANNSAIFVAPDRYVANGQDDNGWPNTNGRDMAFLRAMLDQFNNSLCVDKSRVFSVGWSYGGMMSYAVGREMGDVFRAIAPMSGALWTPFNDSGKPMPAWISHGIYDNVVSHDNGVSARDLYVRSNHCSNNTVPVDPSPCVEYQGCDAGYPVVWCSWNGGHSTPSFSPTAIWKFFNRF